MRNRNLLKGAILFLVATFYSCKKFVQVAPPVNELATVSVFKNDETAIAAVRGIYIRMMGSGSIAGGLNSISHLVGLSSDELKDNTGNSNYLEFNQNSLIAANTIIKAEIWQDSYNYIFHANSILEGLGNSASLSTATKRQLIGEAKFIRAFFYFYLVNLFGDIPLITSTEYKSNSLASRAPVVEVYNQIISDLLEAQSVMIADYSMEGGQRIRPNKWTATALLARVYLFNKEWAKAEEQATSLISNTGLFRITNTLDSTFLKNNTESIWQLMPTLSGYNTLDGNLFIVNSNSPQVFLTDYVFNSFEFGDQRKTKWVNSYSSGTSVWRYPFKYKIKTGASPLNEYTVVLRLAEQYLIRSEARAEQNRVADAQADINVVRNRAGLGNTTATDKSSLLTAIENERFVELFSEWGHRWLDLKRWNRAGAVLQPIKGSGWQPTDVLYPIPQSELDNDPNLTQNDGY